MKITICDDSIKDLLYTEKLLLKYKSLYPDKDFDLEKFSDPSRLCQRISEGKLTDIYILDMLMPRRTGIDIGNLIRTLSCESVIIYITSSEDYALDAYGVRAVRYLLKPVDENKLFEALDYSLSYAKLKMDSLYLIKTKEGLVQRPYSRIEYVENAGRKLEVHMTDGEVLRSLFIRKSFEEETQEIAGQDYILTPGRYVGIEEQKEGGQPFEEKMNRLTHELSDLFNKSHDLEIQIKEELAKIGYSL